MLSGGVYGFNMFSIKPANASQKEYVIPYGALSLKLFSGTVFSPELTIKDSKFIFSENGASIDEQEDNYNYYYLKLPLGFYIPFFGWKSEMYIECPTLFRYPCGFKAIYYRICLFWLIL